MRLRQLSDAADPQTRTFEARYVLEGAAANAPLGATVTVHLSGDVGTEIVASTGLIHPRSRQRAWHLGTEPDLRPQSHFSQYKFANWVKNWQPSAGTCTQDNRS